MKNNKYSADSSARSESPSSGGVRGGLSFIFGAAALLLAAATFGYIGYTAVLAPVVQGDDTVYIQVRPDDTVHSVEERLATAADIRSMRGFAPLMRHYKYATRVKPGNYAVRPGDSMRDICLRLLSGYQTPVRLVIPSVRTLDRLAGAVGHQLMTDSAAVMALLADEHLIDSLGYTRETFPCLFIPNTYEVYWTMTPQQFIARMQKEHQRFWTATRVAKAKAQGLTPDEVMTLASIVDEETAKDDEKPMVARLYLNRLQRGMLLQADPTVKFALGNPELRRILYAHLQTDSPYNTYRYAGLPPGPIRIPTMAAIEAVLNPAKHSYLYMCAREDFSGYHNFATTLSQHNANARRYQQALNKLKIFF